MKKHLTHLRVTAALCAALLLAACGASSGSGDKTSAPQAAYDNGYAAGDMFSEAATESAAYDSAPAAQAESGAALPQTEQKIIYTADLTLESTAFDTARDSLMEAVSRYGAWIEYSELRGTAEDSDRRAYYTVRVPAEHYRAFLQDADAAGNVLSLNESAENITSSYIDVEARLDALKGQRERLNALADQAETTADLIEIESRLSDVQYEIESYTRQLRNMDGQVSYSTVNVSLREVATLTPSGVTFPERLVDAFAGGWNAFVSLVQGIIISVVYLLPLLVCAVVIAAVVVLLVRRHRRKHPRAKRAARYAPPTPVNSAAAQGAPRYSAQPAAAEPAAPEQPAQPEPETTPDETPKA